MSVSNDETKVLGEKETLGEKTVFGEIEPVQEIESVEKIKTFEEGKTEEINSKEAENTEETKEVPKKGIKKILRKSRKFTDFILIGMFFGFIMMYGGQVLAYQVMNFSGIIWRTAAILKDGIVALFMLSYYAFIGIWILYFLFILIFKSNRPIFKTLLYDKEGNNFKGAGIGLLLGFGTNAFCILMSVLFGNIRLSLNRFNIFLIPIFFIAVLIQSGAEEAVSRSYLYQKLRRRYNNPWVAIIGNSVFFMALHLFNQGINFRAILQIVTIAIFLSLIVYYYNCLWACITFHAAWNFTQNILFGCPNSGIEAEYSIFKLDMASATNGIFFDTKFGVEGSFGGILIFIGLIILMIILGRKKGEKKDLWADKN